MHMRILFFFLPFLVTCGTHLSDVDTQSLQAQQVIGASGYEAHAADPTAIDQNRFQAIYCNSRGILMRAGQDAGAMEGGPQCPGAK